MEIRLVRHATLVVRLGEKNLLVDPMLSPPEVMPPFPDTPNDHRNPLVPLPDLDLGLVDAVLVTHTHPDHFDDAAAERLPEDLPILCQPEDEEHLRSSGFPNVCPIMESLAWEGIEFRRTGGRHGTGEIGAAMAPVSGFVLHTPDEPTLYIAGDTIWCPEVEDALTKYQPQVTVVNAGAAQFVTGEPITMSDTDVAEVCYHASETTIIAVHMEAINHCLLSRDDLQAFLDGEDLSQRVHIPADGERINFS